MNTTGGKILRNTFVHVGFAFLAMGGWALFANFAHPMPKPLVAGFVQGVMSGFLTLVLKRTVDWIRPRFSRNPGYWAPPLIASLASATFLVCGHMLAGTPEIPTTIAVPTTVSITYIFIYNIIHQRMLKEG